MMTRRDYVILAQVIREHRECFKSNTQHAKFAAVMALALHDDNPRHDVGSFTWACMPKAWVGTKRSTAWDAAVRQARTLLARQATRRTGGQS